MNHLRIALLLSAATAFAACGLNRYEVPSDVRALAESDVTLEIAWRLPVAETELFGSDPYERGGVAVDATFRTVVATTSNGDVLAVSARTGDLLWRVSIAGEPFAAGPTIANGRVYVACPDGSVRALHLDSGGEIWNRALNDVFSASPTVVGDRVTINSATGKLYALDRETGLQRWSFSRTLRSALTVAGGGQVRTSGAHTVAGFPDGSLAALDSAGEPAWIADLAAGEERLRDVDTTPLVAAGGIFAASFTGGLHRVDAETGEVVWRVDLPGATSPVASGNLLVTTTADGRVLWLNPEDGAIVYELTLDGDDAGELVRWGDYMLMGEPHDGIFVMAAARPWIHARFFPDTGFSSAPAVGDARFWALSNGGVLYGVRMLSLH